MTDPRTPLEAELAIDAAGTDYTATATRILEGIVRRAAWEPTFMLDRLEEFPGIPDDAQDAIRAAALRIEEQGAAAAAELAARVAARATGPRIVTRGRLA